jgi:hypothetical protein
MRGPMGRLGLRPGCAEAFEMGDPGSDRLRNMTLAPLSTPQKAQRMLPLLLLLVLPLPTYSGNVYRCNTNGTTTFVDAPSKCPGGATPTTASRRSEPNLAVKSVPRLGVDQKVTHDVQQTAADPSRATTQCTSQHRADEQRFRDCIRNALRQQTRQIATGRLTDLSRGFAGLVGLPRRRDGIVALLEVGSTRSVQWCEGVIRDVIALSNIEVIDDEEVFTKRWSAASMSLPLLSESFDVAKHDGSTYVVGSVAVLRNNSTPLVLISHSHCAKYDRDGTVCSKQPDPYGQMGVNEANGATACLIAFIGRPYLQNWTGRAVPLNLLQAR